MHHVKAEQHNSKAFEDHRAQGDEYAAYNRAIGTSVPATTTAPAPLPVQRGRPSGSCLEIPDKSNRASFASSAARGSAPSVDTWLPLGWRRGSDSNLSGCWHPSSVLACSTPAASRQGSESPGRADRTAASASDLGLPAPARSHASPESHAFSRAPPDGRPGPPTAGGGPLRHRTPDRGPDRPAAAPTITSQVAHAPLHSSGASSAFLVSLLARRISLLARLLARLQLLPKEHGCPSPHLGLTAWSTTNPMATPRIARHPRSPLSSLLSPLSVGPTVYKQVDLI